MAARWVVCGSTGVAGLIPVSCLRGVCPLERLIPPRRAAIAAAVHGPSSCHAGRAIRVHARHRVPASCNKCALSHPPGTIPLRHAPRTR